MPWTLMSSSICCPVTTIRRVPCPESWPRNNPSMSRRVLASVPKAGSVSGTLTACGGAHTFVAAPMATVAASAESKRGFCLASASADAGGLLNISSGAHGTEGQRGFPVCNACDLSWESYRPACMRPSAAPCAGLATSPTGTPDACGPSV